MGTLHKGDHDDDDDDDVKVVRKIKVFSEWNLTFSASCDHSNEF